MDFLSMKNKRQIQFFRFLVFLCLGLILILFQMITGHQRIIQFFQQEVFTDENKLLQLASRYYLVDTIGCKIPKMDPFDPAVKEYIVPIDKKIEEGVERPVDCGPQPLVSSNLTHIFIDHQAVAKQNLSKMNCCYEPFWRPPLNISTLNENILEELCKDSFEDTFENTSCIYFQESADIGDYEFVKVNCYLESNKSEIIYTDYHSFTPTSQVKTNHETSTTKERQGKLNVLILGVDSVSRLNLIRQMPITLDYVKNELEAIEMIGYNKIDENTFQNLMVILTGYTQNEMRNVCWPNDNVCFDNCPFLWNDFRSAGYATCYAEDTSYIGLFRYFKKGFVKQPTDYYWRTSNYRAEREIGWDKRHSARLCAGRRMVVSMLLDYTEKFAISMSKTNTPFFGLSWQAGLTHDFLNLPRYADDNYRTLMLRLKKMGVLENTLLIFMSDHGIRIGGIRSTYQGYIEERLPFLFFVFPKWFKKKYATAIKNLHLNSHLLTTPFDLHETLRDILKTEGLETDSIKERITYLNEKDNLKRGISLFLPIPKTRTCKDAEIPDTWCTCQTAADISTDDKVASEAANNLIEEINSLLNEQTKCANVELEKILNVRVEQTQNYDEYESSVDCENCIKDFIISVETKPGGAIFEAIVRRDTDNKYHTIGTVSRTNSYGNQSACVHNYQLKPYCYCIEESE